MESKKYLAVTIEKRIKTYQYTPWELGFLTQVVKICEAGKTPSLKQRNLVSKLIDRDNKKELSNAK